MDSFKTAYQSNWFTIYLVFNNVIECFTFFLEKLPEMDLGGAGDAPSLPEPMETESSDKEDVSSV